MLNKMWDGGTHAMYSVFKKITLRAFHIFEQALVVRLEQTNFNCLPSCLKNDACLKASQK